MSVGTGCARETRRKTDAPAHRDELSPAELLEQMRSSYASANGDRERLQTLEAQLLVFLAEIPDDAAAMMLLASVYQDQGRAELASSTAERCIKLDPELADGWLTFGVIEQTRGRDDRASLAYRKYLQLEPQGEHASAVRAQLQKLGAPSSAPPPAGDVDKKGVRAYINERTGALRECYETMLHTESDLAGNMTFTFAVDTAGVVTTVVVEPGSIEHERLRACTTKQIYEWRFPEAEDRAEVTFSVVFAN